MLDIMGSFALGGLVAVGVVAFVAVIVVLALWAGR